MIYEGIVANAITHVGASLKNTFKFGELDFRFGYKYFKIGVIIKYNAQSNAENVNYIEWFATINHQTIMTCLQISNFTKKTYSLSKSIKSICVQFLM